MKTLKITTDNKISIVDVDFKDFRSIQQAVGGYFETVKTRKMWDYFKAPVIMLVDEEGLIKGLSCNAVASVFYGIEEHGCMIAGDVIFGLVLGEDIIGFGNRDVYKYLGAADITLQTAFGFKYLTNFLGADVVFVTSEIPQNVVIATPLNNMIAYYVDPGDSEFAKAGLGFTTDSETGFIGFHSEGTYSRMISDNYAIMGLRLFCEYLDAIAYISVGESDTQTLGTLSVTSEAGSEAGDTKLTVKEQLLSPRNCWKYKDAAAATSVTYGMDVKNWSKWDGESEIASTAGHHITLVECDQNYKAVRSGDVAVTVNPGA